MTMSSRKPTDKSTCEDRFADRAIHRLLDRPLTDDDLRDSAQRVAQPIATVNDETKGFLHFELAGEGFLLPSCDIGSVTHVVVVRRIPHRSNHMVRGLCHIDGELLICGNLASLMQLPESSESLTDESSRMIVLGRRDRWVVQVQFVHGVVQLDPGESLGAPITVRDARQSFVTSMTHIDGQLVSLLDTHALISAFQEALK